MTVFGTFGNNVISLLIGLFSRDFLHSTNLRQVSFQSILFRPSGDSYFLFFQPSKVLPKNRPFLKNFPWSPFAILPKMTVFGTFGNNVISPLIGLFSCSFLHSTNLGQFSFQSILIRPSGDLYFLLFQPSEVRSTYRPFLKNFPWSPLCYFAKNGRFRYFWAECYFSSNRSFSMQFFAQHKSRIVQLSIHTIQAIRRLVFPICLAFRSSTKNSAIFQNFSLVPPLLFCQKCPFSVYLGKNVVSPVIGLFAYGFLHSTNLGQFSFQSILFRPSGDLYFLYFQPSEVLPKNRPFLKIFPWSLLCYFAKNGRFQFFWEKCYFSSNRSCFVRFFAQHESRIELTEQSVM